MVAAAPSQISWTDNTSSPLEKPKVPLRRWVLIAAMFFSINMLNNWAFAFNISVPVHIILRSFGSVSTMLMGWLRGKRYSKLQVLSVTLLTFGVLLSAWADAAGKVGLEFCRLLCEFGADSPVIGQEDGQWQHDIHI